MNNLVIANQHDGLSLADAFTVHPVANGSSPAKWDFNTFMPIEADCRCRAYRQPENSVHLTGLQKDILADCARFQSLFAGTRFPAEEVSVSDIGGSPASGSKIN